MAYATPEEYKNDPRTLAELYNSTKAHALTARDDYLTVDDDDEAVYDNAFKAYRKRTSDTKKAQESTTSQSPSDDSSYEEPVTIRPERYDIDRSLIHKTQGPGIFSSVIQQRLKNPESNAYPVMVRKDVGKSSDTPSNSSATSGDVGRSLHALQLEIREMRAVFERQLFELKNEIAHIRALVQKIGK